MKAAITDRLRSLDAPTKSSQYWNKASVVAILKNPAYTGKTISFKTHNDWIEIPAVTPAIISQDLFDAAQKQLYLDKTKAIRNTKHEYLLRGHIRCRQCNRAYWGYTSRTIQRYRCSGTQRILTSVERCHNKSWKTDKLEAIVWAELERYLSDHDLIKNELEKQHQDAAQQGVYEEQLQQIERQFRAVDREQRQLLQWALKDFPSDQVEAENRRLNKAKETLKAQKAELEAQLRASQDAVINVTQLEGFIRDIQDKLPYLDFEGKRLALDMLGITVWIDGENVEISCTINSENVSVVTTAS
ncbi:recombinase family protein [Chloroflexota bacterium]